MAHDHGTAGRASDAELKWAWGSRRRIGHNQALVHHSRVNGLRQSRRLAVLPATSRVVNAVQGDVFGSAG
jgi:hypothetical protein